jgi:hypothetical protein
VVGVFVDLVLLVSVRFALAREQNMASPGMT